MVIIGMTKREITIMIMDVNRKKKKKKKKVEEEEEDDNILTHYFSILFPSCIKND